MALKTYSENVSDVVSWLENTGQAMGTDPTQRIWCTLGLEGLDAASIQTYFDRSDVNTQYETEYNLGVLTNNPVAFLQQDSDGLYALQKSFILRHQGRLGYYRDDCEQKDVRIYNALNAALAKYQHMKDKA